jgi:hypothetical protein
MLELRLWLVGDDEVLDVLAELSRHLDYFSIARADDLPAEPLGAQDHLVVAFTNAALGPKLLARALAAGSPGFAGVVPEEEGDSIGARAIVIAADLVSAIHDRR